MIEILTNTYILLINSFIFGLFTKVADLLNEHGLTMFNRADIFFGILWGVTGLIVVAGHNFLASFYLGILVNWIIKGNIDYFNHRLATAIILTVVFYLNIAASIDWLIFLVTLFLFTFIGLMLRKGMIKKTFFTNNNLHVFSVFIILAIVNKEYWIIVASYFLNSVAYHAIKQWGIKNLADY